MSIRKLIALPLALMGAQAALAQTDDPMCRNGLFPSEPPFALARIGGKERAYFQSDMDGCPWKGDACRARAYVVPGDVVIINRTRDGFACAFYPSSGGGTAGWIDSRRVELLPAPASPPLAAWLGTWSSEGNPTVRFERKLDTLHVSGEAFWPSPAPTSDYPSIHIGEIAGEVQVSGRLGHYADDAMCEVRFTLLGDYLIAGDNRQCGGVNVSFSAVYRREG
ncbi:hypothetical protein B2G71_00305 [Novosphingobium sp. PC22D]|uniref:hypothetical protein n=1 Tax=Novosphingobium sp. PC22D TaxID=1962403 RepID=UPI000BF0687F|nr:hypothetical protein [Novosphingobium sp. PC22D]PEQ14103.1 hypothetical protein B2G71_00305 [Novosphingobium sp. PC22D]